MFSLDFFGKHIEMCSQRPFLDKLYKLRKEEHHLLATIAVSSFDKAIQNIERAYLNQEFVVDNMFEANLNALGCLAPGEHFLCVSAVLNPDHWNHDEHLVKYKELNYEKAAAGVIINRIFILQNQEEIEVMADIMNEQAKNGIQVEVVLEDDLKHLSFFPDFTVLPERGSALYVPNLSKLMQCYATNIPKIVSDIEKDFATIKQKSQLWQVK